jgi:yapsin 1
MKNDGFINRAAFSLWLNSLDDADGSLLFGGYDTSKFSGDLVSLPIWNSGTARNSSTPFEYTAKLESVLLDGKVVGNTTQALLFDSGASVCYFQAEVLDGLISLFNAAYDTPGGYYICACDVISPGEHYLSFKFDGATFGIDAYDLLIPFELGDVDSTCLVGALGSSSESRSIFGDSILRSLYVIFDQDALLLQVANAVTNATTTSNIVAFDPYSGQQTATVSLAPSLTGRNCVPR